MLAVALSRAFQLSVTPASVLDKEVENLTRQLCDLQSHMAWFRMIGAGAFSA